MNTDREREAGQGSRERKKPGPVAGSPKERTTIYIEPELSDWGKRQPGGFSELVRRLIQEEKSRQEAANA